jgi:hypothetical protein
MTTDEKFIEYSTSDFATAAFLWTQAGIDYKEAVLAPGTSNKLIFVFRACGYTSDTLNELLLRYCNKKCMVEPNALVAAQNALRNIVHSKTRKN